MEEHDGDVVGASIVPIRHAVCLGEFPGGDGVCSEGDDDDDEEELEMVYTQVGGKRQCRPIKRQTRSSDEKTLVQL